jgi:hypothetical protein
MGISAATQLKDSAAVLTVTVLLTSVMIIISFQLPQAAADTHNDIADFNGDGYTDLVIGSPPGDPESFDSKITIVYGSPSGFSPDDESGSMESQVLPHNIEYIGCCMTIGDFNGDGYSDLAFGTRVDGGLVFVVYGSSEGLSTVALEDGTGRDEQTFSSADFGVEFWRFGQSLATGDFNNDGFDDLAAGAPDYPGIAPITGAVIVIYGSSDGLSLNAIAPGDGRNDQKWTQNSPSIDGVGEDQEFFGHTVAVADFNDDGYDDLSIAVPHESLGTVNEAGAVNVIYGSSEGLKATAAADGSGQNDQLFHQDMGLVGKAEQGDSFGETLTTGDFNGDGYGDLAVGIPRESIGANEWAGAVNVIYGSSQGLKVTAAGDGTGRNNQMWHQNSPLINGASEPFDIFGASLTSGDFNNDGYDDLAAAASFESIGTIAKAGAVNVIYGSPTGLSATFVADQMWHQNSPNIEDVAEVFTVYDGFGEEFGTSVASGDFNNDGYFDLAVGVWNEEKEGGSSRGAVNVIYGSPTGLSATFVPDQFLEADQYIDLPTVVDSFGWQLASTNSNFSYRPGHLL